MPRINIYIPDSEHDSLQVAQANMKNAGESLSGVIMVGLKASKFWPKKAPSKKSAAKKR